jgi:hypothetical protein
MKKNIFKISILFFSLSVLFTSCFKDLDRLPFYEQTSVVIYEKPENYIHVLAKLYAGLAVSGQVGPAGNADLAGIDEGFSQYLRQFWQLQELPTDEAVIAWNDGTIQELNKMNWSSRNEFITVLYNRIMYQITLCNEFIKQSKESRLRDRGFGQADIDRILKYREEARFLKALSMFHGLDLYGNIPNTSDEEKFPGSEFPTQFTKVDLFNYIESELLAIEGTILTRSQSEYGRANQACVQTLLAKLYLNAEAMIGVNKYAEAVTYCEKVINSGSYSLSDSYRNLFLADNHTSNEFIFPITFDGIKTKTFGGTTYLVHAPVGGPAWNAADSFGISSGGWFGLRTTGAFYDQFPDSTDRRYMFFKNGHTKEIPALGTFTNGYGIAKWKNIKSNGEKGSDPVTFADTDFPLFRLADVYLMYAEASLRSGAGSPAQALNYVNQIRERAYGNSNNNITELTLDIILNERARELYWEAHRRTDLIRFGKFTGGSYLWPWKGGAAEGTSVSDNFKVYPIPFNDLVANPNLKQNSGY